GVAARPARDAGRARRRAGARARVDPSRLRAFRPPPPRRTRPAAHRARRARSRAALTAATIRGMQLAASLLAASWSWTTGEIALALAAVAGAVASRRSLRTRFIEDARRAAW